MNFMSHYKYLKTGKSNLRPRQATPLQTTWTALCAIHFCHVDTHIRVIVYSVLCCEQSDGHFVTFSFVNTSAHINALYYNIMITDWEATNTAVKVDVDIRMIWRCISIPMNTGETSHLLMTPWWALLVTREPTSGCMIICSPDHIWPLTCLLWGVIPLCWVCSRLCALHLLLG